MLALVIGNSRILTGGYAAGVFGKLGVGVHIYKVQPRFAAPTARTRALGHCCSVGGVDSLPLRSVDKFLRILASAAFERKYFSGAFKIKISDNEHPLS